MVQIFNKTNVLIELELLRSILELLLFLHSAIPSHEAAKPKNKQADKQRSQNNVRVKLKTGYSNFPCKKETHATASKNPKLSP